jgi:CheY-like chemotaxis protein
MPRILLADDEANLRRLLAKVLKMAGFDVVEAATGHEALALAEPRQLDVLVTDVVMDDMDGLALADRVAAKCGPLPVVFISGYAMDMEAAQRRHPCSTFLRKPFPPKALASAIKELMARGQQSE